MNEYSKYLALKSSFENLFGSRAWLELKTSNHLPTWKKYASKSLKAISVSINESIEIYDEEWIQEIESTIREGICEIESSKSIDELTAALAGYLIRVSFLQIGDMPRRKGSGKNYSLNSRNWQLGKFRKAVYLQTKTQKEDLFWSKQQRKIGFQKQISLHDKYRESKSELTYMDWCEENYSKEETLEA